jgi:hypothetical protein
MSSERRTIQGEVPDGIADRSQGYTHNPNPEEELAVQRARFAENQRQLQHDREEAADAISEVEANLAEQYRAAQHNPDHQAFIPEQRAEQEALGSATHGGHFDTSGSTMPETIGGGEMMREVTRPNPQDPDHLPNKERS